jgi:ABC-type Zn uptake system ZnuABC Zn-binding protein ZnuA
MVPGTMHRRRSGRPAHAPKARALAWAWALSLSAVLCPALAGAAPEPVRVAVSIHPLALLVQAVGGEGVAVSTLLRPGASPHGYEPTPSEVSDLARAQLLVTVGSGLDPWAERLRRAVARDVPDLELAAHTTLLAAQDADTPGGDPHVWLDPVRVRDDLVPAVVRALSDVAPDRAADFARGGEAFQRELTALDRDLAEGLAPYRDRGFVAFHASWTYFAARYHLRQVAVVEAIPGREPSARWMHDVIEAGRASGARAVLIEPQFNPRIARTIAEQFGARVVLVNPLGAVEPGARDTYADLLRSNLRAFQGALGG